MRALSLVVLLLLVTATVPASVPAGADTADSEPPLADAGLDQSVVPGTTVYLDGGGSLDPDGEIESYRWSIETPRGETRTPQEPNAAMTRFVPQQPGRYLVELTVSDQDGHSRSDTLYVDVGGAVDAGADDSTENQAADPADAEPPQVVDGPTAPAERGRQNQAPFGQILGPNSVASGSTVRYVLAASDTDGNVASYRWLPASHRTGSSGIIDPQQSSQTYRFDVPPGSTVRLPAVVVDDDGASSTVEKTVQVTNNRPNAAIHGESTVAVGSVHEYEVVASDPDGPITDYDWVTASSAVERVQTGGLVSGDSTDGSKTALYRFTTIPEADATVPLRATVRDEHGGSATAEKGVTVVEIGTELSESPINRNTPKINQFNAHQNGRSRSLFGPQDAQSGRIVFTATATDNDSDQLTFEWEFGDLGTAATVERGGKMTSEVSFAFDSDEVSSSEEISLTVTDQNGRSRTVTKTLEFVEQAGGKRVNGGISATVVEDRLIRGSLSAPTLQDGESPSYVYIYFGDGEKQRIETMEKVDEVPTYEFEHRYQTAGQFTIQGHYETSISRTTVSVGEKTYTQWTYEQKVTENTQTVAAKRPGDEWKRLSVDHINHNQIGVLTEETQIIDGETIVPGSTWERVGTKTEYSTEQRTRRSVDSPGSGWERSERNVDQRTVFEGWETRTVPSKWMADSEWEYVREVARTTTTTETEHSTTRPAGGGWQRGSETGDSVVTGYTSEWVTSRYFVDDDWRYVRADRYVSGYTYSTTCVERADFGYRSYCVEEQTTRSPTYDTRYKYRVPQYSTEYEWVRTVEETTYDYEYRVETYSTEAVHEYTKDVQVGTEYAQWEKPEYKSTQVYKWKKTETSWEEKTALSEPTGDVRDVEKQVHQCGKQPEQEPATCSEDQS